MKYNIAFLMHGLGFGGAGTSLYLLIKSLKNYSYDKFLYTSHITFDNALNDYMKYCKSFNIIPIDRINNDLAGGKTPIRKFEKLKDKKYPELINLLNQQQIDIIHINSSVFPHLLEQIKAGTKCKIVTHVREMIPLYDNGEVQRYMIEHIKKYSDAIICISDNESVPFLDHKNINVVANPFDSDSIKNISGLLRNEYQIPSGVLLVGVAGKFTYSKGQLEFLRSVKYLLDNYKLNVNVKFILMGFYYFNPRWKVLIKKIVGRQDYGAEIQQYILKNDLGDKIILLPYKYDFLNYLTDMDILVRPALSADPWGRDIIESMAFGKPVIATGLSEFYVKNNKSGFLVSPGEPSEMAGKMYQLICDEKLRESFGENGQTIIREKCDLNNYGERINNIYKSLL